MDYLQKLIVDIELHSVEGIRECFSNGIHPNKYLNGRPLIWELIGEYTRSPRFKECINVFVEFGLIFEDRILLSVLRDDPISLQEQLKDDSPAVYEKCSLPCAYTPLYEVTLLHVCAEFNHLACANVLVAHGADINAKAGVDEHGFGGHTPVFHTVNQNGDQSCDMLQYLLLQEADLTINVAGLIWGKGYPWETFIPAVNPISYAMMGLLPQMHRNEGTIAAVVSLLLKSAYGIEYMPENVPCAYLR